MKHPTRRGGTWRIGILAGALLFTSAGAQAGGWCDIVFKDVAQEADLVVIAEMQRDRPRESAVRVVEILKGEMAPPADDTLELSPAALQAVGVKKNDRLLLALNDKRRPVVSARGMGACTAISILPIRGGRLQARDRVNYDSRRGALSLDQLRSELASGR